MEPDTRKKQQFVERSSVRRRKYPFPYRAMLSISSDLDGTRSFDDYIELLKYLNTDSQTSLGPGLGLEFANSIYFAMRKNQFAYWNVGDEGREKTRELLRRGLIDTLHSFGDIREKRDLDAALDEIIIHRMRFPIWVNHAEAPTNLSSARRPGKFHGDDTYHELYHVDRLLSLGLAYVCRGQATSVIGQEVRPGPASVLYRQKPLESAATAMIQAAKLAASPVSSRYRMHLRNRVLSLSVLADGSEALEVMRANWHWGGIGAGASLGQLGEILRVDALDTLVRRQGASVLYTHLGLLPIICGQPHGQAAIRGLCLLANFARERDILVKSTAWMLDYLALCSSLRYSVGRDDCLTLEIGEHGSNEMADRLRSFLPTSGLSFYFEHEFPPRIIFCGQPLAGITVNPPDKTGVRSVSLPIGALQFPEDI